MADGTTVDDTLYNARPTLRFGGQQDARASALLERMTMREGEGGLSALQLSLSNWASFESGDAGYAFDASPVVRLGGPIEVACGPVDRPTEIFRGQITGLESVHQRGRPPQLIVHAEDDMLPLRQQRRSRVLVDKTADEVLQAVAGAAGLASMSADSGSPRQTWVQLDETDLAFLRRVLARVDCDLRLENRILFSMIRGTGNGGTTLNLDLGADLRSVRVFADLADQVTSVSARGWDAAAGSVVRGEISDGAYLGPGQGRLGARLLREAFGERPDNLGHFAVQSDAEARALAQAAFDHRARRFVRASGITEGRPTLRLGSLIRLSGLGSRYDNDYCVTATCHRYDLEDGYSTEFDAECAYLGGTA